MRKPISEYSYYPYLSKGYDDWAKKAYEEDDFYLDSYYSNKLEEIYDSDNYTEIQHKENLEFLETLKYYLNYVWTYTTFQRSGMMHLVNDYKKYHDIG